MNSSGIDEQLDRLEIIYRHEYDGVERDEIAKCFRDLTDDRFTVIVDHLIRTARYLPKIPAFFGALEATRTEWAKHDDQPTGCPECFEGFQPVYFITNGLAYRGVAPCRSCNRSFKIRGHKPTVERWISREDYNDFWQESQQDDPKYPRTGDGLRSA